MKRVITYTADRGQVIRWRDLDTIVRENQEQLEVKTVLPPKVVTDGAGGIKKIITTREIW